MLVRHAPLPLYQILLMDIFMPPIATGLWWFMSKRLQKQPRNDRRSCGCRLDQVPRLVHSCGAVSLLFCIDDLRVLDQPLQGPRQPLIGISVGPAFMN